MIIRSQQMDAFQQTADAAYVKRTVQYIRNVMNELFIIIPEGPTEIARLDDKALEELVKGGMLKARSFGLSWERNLTAFILLMFTVAPNFSEQSRIKTILEDPKIPPDNRMDKFNNEEITDALEEASENYDPFAWVIGGKGD